MSDTRRVLIAGAGAVGGYIGVHLARAGHAVTLIDPWWENVAAIRAWGLSITGITAEEAFTQPVRALGVGEAQSLVREAPFDYAFVAMKSYDTRWAAELVLPYLGPDGVIASAQNGINDPTIAAVAGPERTVGIVVAGTAEPFEPARIRRAVPRAQPGNLEVGELDGRSTERVAALAGLLNAVDSTLVTTDLPSRRWTTLVVNAMRNAVSAATGLSGNDITRVEAVRRAAIRIGGEAIRVGRAKELTVGRVTGIDPDDLQGAAEGDAERLARVEAIMLAGTGYRADLGRRPELAGVAVAVALWRDRYAPPPGEEDAGLAANPYLGPGFEFVEKAPGTAPFLKDIHNFTYGGVVSHGRAVGEIASLRHGVPRLVSAIGRDLWLADRAAHLARLRAFDTPDLTGEEYAHALWSPPVDSSSFRDTETPT